MSFTLRAALAIGALAYFALQRDGGGGATDPWRAAAERHAADLGALANQLPADLRNAAAQAATAELARRLAADPPSRDTLLAVDRRPEWRGATAR